VVDGRQGKRVNSDEPKQVKKEDNPHTSEQMQRLQAQLAQRDNEISTEFQQSCNSLLILV
jgi:hypothetical protein